MSLGLRWLVIGLMVCGGVGLRGAPDRVDQTMIHVTGAEPGTAVAALVAAVMRRADADTQVSRRFDGVLIERRVGTGLLDPPMPGVGDLADRAVADMRWAAAATLAAPRADDAVLPLLRVRRDGLQERLGAADQQVAAFSGALTGVARQIADLQRSNAGAGDTGDAPGRALLATLQARRIDLQAKYTDGFPAIAITDAEIARVQSGLDRAAARRARPDAAAIVTLQGEYQRVSAALREATARRDGFSQALGEVDRAMAARVAPPVVATPAAVDYRIEDGASQSAPDWRLPICGGVALASLVLARLAGRSAVRRRPARATGFAARVGAIEREVGLPVLRCLDVEGREVDVASVDAGFAAMGHASPRLRGVVIPRRDGAGDVARLALPR